MSDHIGKGNIGGINDPINSTTPSTVTSIGTITSVNTYKLNLDDFDKAVTPSFSRNEVEGIYTVEKSSIDGNNYNIKVADGDVIVSSFDNTTLIDTDFKARKKSASANDLGAFDNAIINYYDKLKDVKINALSLEKLNKNNLFLCDTVGDNSLNSEIVTKNEATKIPTERILTTIDNIVPYRELVSNTAVTKYENVQDYLNVKIEVNGKLISFDKYIGFVDAQVNGIDFRLICGRGKDNKYYEYLTTKEHCIFVRRLKNIEEPVMGTRLNYEGSIGNYEMQYRKLITYYLNIKSVVLGEDNMYYVTTNDNLLFVIPAKCYSFEFRKKTNLIPESADTLDLSKYLFLFYDQDSFEFSIISSTKKLVKVGNTYLYVVDQPLNLNTKVNNENNTALPNPTASVFNAESSALARVISTDEFKSNYSIASQPIDFAFNIVGNSFSDDNDADCKYIAFKEINLLGLECYAMVSELPDPANNSLKYLEVVVPKNFVCIKGNEQDIAKQKVLK